MDGGFNHWLQNLPSRASKCVGLPRLSPPRMIQSAIHAIICGTPTRGWPNSFEALFAVREKCVFRFDACDVRGALPNSWPKSSQTRRTLRVSGPVTFRMIGGQDSVIERGERHARWRRPARCVEVAHRDVDGFAPKHPPGQIDQHAVTHLDGVVQADDRHRDARVRG